LRVDFYFWQKKSNKTLRRCLTLIAGNLIELTGIVGDNGLHCQLSDAAEIAESAAAAAFKVM
jgi:hypothetical protein